MLVNLVDLSIMASVRPYLVLLDLLLLIGIWLYGDSLIVLDELCMKSHDFA